MSAKKLTFSELAGQTLGSTVSWADPIPLIHAAASVHVCFHAHDGKKYLGRSLEIPKQAALDRAVWAAQNHAQDGEAVNVSACGGTLWFGAS